MLNAPIIRRVFRSRVFGLTSPSLSRVSAGLFLLAWLFVLTGLPNGLAHAYKLPDTGQIKCYGNATEMDSCPGPGERFYGQDAQFPKHPLSYKDNEDKTVTDLNTGLMWQQEDDQNASWRPWQEAVDYCADLGLANHSDWRLPSVEELTSLVHIGQLDPAINPQVFPQCLSKDYWSNNTLVTNEAQASHVGFSYGYVGRNSKQFGVDYVRCVRGNAVPGANYQANRDGVGTVTDLSTGLIWQQSDDGQSRTWEEALAYCANLDPDTPSQWRLPNYRELASLVDYSRSDPAINPLFGYSSSSLASWSSSTAVDYPDHAWCATFKDIPGVNRTWKKFHLLVRCVRDVPKYTLTITPNPVEGGIVTGPGIKCGTGDEKTWIKCEKTYEAGTKVKLKAKAMDGWTFVRWEDGEFCNATARRTITMNRNKTIAAIFAAEPLAVPRLSQNDPQWACDQLGKCSTDSLGEYKDAKGRNVCRKSPNGCNITAQAMIFNYYATILNDNPEFTDPSILNEQLTNNNAYGECHTGMGDYCCTNWPEDGTKPIGAPQEVIYANSIAVSGLTTTVKNIIDSSLDNRNPVLAEVKCTGVKQHYVVIIGKNNNTYWINDPWNADKTYTLAAGAFSGSRYTVKKLHFYSTCQ